MDTAIDGVLGRALKGVAHYMVPTVHWEVSVPLHIVDYGVELNFDGEYLSLVWEDGSHKLLVLGASLEGGYPSPERSSVVASPWDELIGRRLVSGRFGSGESPCGPEHHWVAQLEFERDASVWIAAASYFEGGNLLIPCSDEVVVAWSPDVAHTFGLVVRHN